MEKSYKLILIKIKNAADPSNSDQPRHSSEVSYLSESSIGSLERLNSI